MEELACGFQAVGSPEFCISSATSSIEESPVFDWLSLFFLARNSSGVKGEDSMHLLFDAASVFALRIDVEGIPLLAAESAMLVCNYLTFGQQYS